MGEEINKKYSSSVQRELDSLSRQISIMQGIVDNPGKEYEGKVDKFKSAILELSEVKAKIEATGSLPKKYSNKKYFVALVAVLCMLIVFYMASS